MTAYPFSGTIRANIIEEPPQTVSTIIDRYCEHFGVTWKVLKITPNRTVKLMNGVRIDSMRMALAYYIRQYMGLPYKEIAHLVGYRNHSTPIKNRGRVESYIDTRDSVFYPYWNVLKEIA